MTNKPMRTSRSRPVDRHVVPADAASAGDASHTDGIPHRELPLASQRNAAQVSRRRFLEAAGFTFSLAALSGCRRADEEFALPFVEQPAGRVPGAMTEYASTCAGCPAACGLLIGVRDGRPLKMEGMPEHPLSRGGLCAVGQALPLSLYDRLRLTVPQQAQKDATWSDVDKAIMQQLDDVAKKGGAVRFVTGTTSSPTLNASIAQFLDRFEDARHITFDAISCTAILDAHKATHGKRLLPHFHFDLAEVIVSFGADFLGTWISPVEYTAAWSKNRVPTADDAHMSYHVQFEGRMSLTGSKADHRYRLASDQYAVVLSYLVKRLATRAGQTVPEGTVGTPPVAPAVLSGIVDRLWQTRGKSLVLCDSQDVEVQKLVNAINHYLGNYGKTVDINRPSLQRQGNDADVLQLIEELEDGKVGALLVAGTDLIHNLPNGASVAETIGSVPLVISFADRLDDLAAHAHFVCPDVHPLLAWLDAEPIRGLVTLLQPTMRPLGKTRPILESLARWNGQDFSALQIVQKTWEKQFYPQVKKGSFRDFWERAVHDGFVELPLEQSRTAEFQADRVKLLGDRPASKGLSLALYSKVGLSESCHAHNAWLQELPDPITKVTWDNYVAVSAAVAEDLQIVDGDLVTLATDAGNCSVDLPALVQRGQHDRVVAVALAYGVKGTDRFANIGPEWLEGRPTTVKGTPIGKNVAPFIATQNGTFRYARDGVTLTKKGGRQDLAVTQTYDSLTVPKSVAPRGAEVRDLVQKTTLPAFAKDPSAGAPHHHHDSADQLWPDDHPKPRASWGMTIDLNKCSGCSACLIACQSENNVPVVGRDEVRRRREMHWIRIDRYYSGEGDAVRVDHQPMMCQHCDNAPCETVCPVLATVHSDEGLNEQAYNRCVGTRYCANNCPYKVRRFNWFKYQHDDEVQNLALNPDVTVRMRGVMEKCSMCIQRIEQAKIGARRRGEPLADGDAQTACQQSCPAHAITFGNLNDSASQVHDTAQNPRYYRVLEEFNFRPSVGYLRVVDNSDAEEAENGNHV